MKPKYIRPFGKPIRDPWWKVLLRGILTTVITVGVAMLMASIVIEWMVGCGETYTDSKGERHANQCVFIKP